MTPADLKEARRKLGLSVKQMAHLIDTDPVSVRRMEGSEDAKTHRTPAPRMVRLIRAYLDGYRPKDWPDVQPKPHPLNMRGHEPDADGRDPYKWEHEQSEEVQAIEKARSLQHWKRMTAPLEDGEAD